MEPDKETPMWEFLKEHKTVTCMAGIFYTSIVVAIGFGAWDYFKPKKQIVEMAPIIVRPSDTIDSSVNEQTSSESFSDLTDSIDQEYIKGETQFVDLYINPPKLPAKTNTTAFGYSGGYR